jgi:ubiquitin-conjugating enzyme E2 J2
MASIIQKKRLTNEVKLLYEQPLHYCTARPDESNPLIWYFLIIGQKGTDYHGGEYIGRIVHSPKYPAEPPDYYMLTPSGRYNVGSKICLTNSSYHKGDWSSTWNILSILIAFYSIWLDDKESGISHIKDTPTNRKRMAMESIEYNNKNNKEIYEKFDRTHLKDDDPVILKKKVVEQEPTETTKVEKIQEQAQVLEQAKVQVLEQAQVLEQEQLLEQEQEQEQEQEPKAKAVKKIKVAQVKKVAKKAVKGNY